MSQMNLHFAVRFLIIGIALIYVVGPMFWHWREVLTARSGVLQAGSLMTFVQFTQPDDQPIVINTEKSSPLHRRRPTDKALASPSPTAAIRT